VPCESHPHPHSVCMACARVTQQGHAHGSRGAGPKSPLQQRRQAKDHRGGVPAAHRHEHTVPNTHRAPTRPAAEAQGLCLWWGTGALPVVALRWAGSIGHAAAHLPFAAGGGGEERSREGW